MAGVVNTSISPQQARLAATHVVRTLRGGKHTAYFAGGCVRDELLGLHPSDYDVATDARPERIKELFPRTAAVGAAFGVMLVHVDGKQLPGLGVGGGVTVEVATFRSDGEYTDARRPDKVHFSTDREDAARRDFTINALFLDPLDPSRDVQDGGKVIDYVGGVDDLKRKIIRAVGDADARLAEDHLRALRAARFAARLGFDIDAATAAAIRRHASELRGVSRERIGDELRRMMSLSSRDKAVEWLRRLDLEQPALGSETGRDAPANRSDTPRLTALDRVGSALPGLRVLGWDDRPPPSPRFGECLAAWWLDRLESGVYSEQEAAGAATRLRSALCLSNAETDELIWTLRIYHQLQQFGQESGGWEGMRVSRRRRIAATGMETRGRPFAAACVLLWGVEPERAARIVADASALAAGPIGLAPPPLLTGDELVAFGMKPGPSFKRILDEVYDAQLEGTITTVSEARELAGRLGV